jgi:aspartate aminotransferase
VGEYIDTVPWSGIIRIRDMMFSVKDPFRLDQGDVSFDAPASVKAAMSRAIAENRTHYIQSTGLPRLRELMTAKMRTKNGIPVGDVDEVLVTNGGTHALYVMFQAVLEPGDEVLLPDPAWPPTVGHAIGAHATPVFVPLREATAWRYDLDRLRAAVTPRTRAIYINSPHNPTGGVLTRADVETIAEIARERNLWVFSDEAYEDVLFKGEHVSIGSLPGMYERTIPMFTMSKSYAMTGVRVGYLAVKDAKVRDRAKKILLYTTSNVCSIAQYGAIGGLEGPQETIAAFATELRARRDSSTKAFAALEGCSPENRQTARSTRSFESIQAGAAPPPQPLSRGRWQSTSSSTAASAVSPAQISGPRAKATFGSASRASARSSLARSSRCGSSSVYPRPRKFGTEFCTAGRHAKPRLHQVAPDPPDACFVSLCVPHGCVPLQCRRTLAAKS